jgi:hypothetical protein
MLCWVVWCGCWVGGCCSYQPYPTQKLWHCCLRSCKEHWNNSIIYETRLNYVTPRIWCHLRHGCEAWNSQWKCRKISYEPKHVTPRIWCDVRHCSEAWSSQWKCRNYFLRVLPVRTSAFSWLLFNSDACMQRAHGKIQSKITWLAYEYCCKITARRTQRLDPRTCTKLTENHIKSQQQHQSLTCLAVCLLASSFLLLHTHTNTHSNRNCSSCCCWLLTVVGGFWLLFDGWDHI